MLASGMSANGVMAELTGREGGYSKGKGGSMHMFSKESHFYGGHGIVGAQVPLGAGLAFADAYLGNDNVTFTYFGDGSANQGQVYETLNMAKNWKLPCVFVLENNKYAMGTSQNRSTSSPIHERVAAFGIPTEIVDGMDVFAIKEAGGRAAAHCRAGEGPYMLEIKTYRYRGHSMSDPAKYRSKDEVNHYKKNKDPIDAIREVIIDGDYSTEDELKAIDKEVKEVVNASAEFAKLVQNHPWMSCSQTFIYKVLMNKVLKI